MSFYTKLLSYFVPRNSFSEPKSTFEEGDYEVIVAVNEVGEEVILYFPKSDKGIVSV